MVAVLAVPDLAAPAVELARVPAPQQPPLSLYALEESLLCLADTAEMVPPEQEAEFLAQFQKALKAAVEKRDRVGQFMAHLEGQAALAAEEVKRLSERKAFYDRALERVGNYVMSTIKSIGQDAKGKWPKLEGKVTTFQMKKCPPSVEITDDAAVPQQYKSATVTIPLPLWDKLLDSLELDFAGEISDAVSKARIEISKTAVKEGLQAKQHVPGTHLVDDKYRLERK